MSNEIEEEMEVDDLLDSLDEMARLDGAKSSIDAMQIIEEDFAEKTNEDDGISEKTEIINRLRKEVLLCEDIKTRIPKMKENLNELKKEEKAREEELELKKNKRKEKRL